MKKFFYLIAALAMVGFVACDDNKKEEGEATLIGTWQVVALYDFVDGEWVLDEDTLEGDETTTFTTDGKQIDAGGEQIYNQEYTYNPETKVITTTYDGNTSTATVDKLTQTELVLIHVSNSDNSTYKVVYKKK